MRSAALLLAILAIGCDAVVSDQPGTPREEIRSVSCSYPGVCNQCGLTMQGKFECGFGFHAFCDGDQEVRVQITPYLTRYESGRIYGYERETVMETLEACK